MLAGIGFTMALFIADLAFQGTLLQAAKLGILAASLVSAAVGLALLAWLGRGRSRRPAGMSDADEH
jgi:Na+:H+ antiporter, NhaA family